MLRSLWQSLKRQRRIALGQATLLFQFTRTSPVRRTGRPGTVTRQERTALALALARAREETESPGPGRTQTAMLVGVGPGLGEALALALASEGFNLMLVARDGVRLEAFAQQIRGLGVTCLTFPGDVTHENTVDAIFRTVHECFGYLDLAVYGLQFYGSGSTCDIEVPAFEDGLRHNCFGAFLVARSAARLMTEAGQGTIVLVGSTSSILGREGHLNLAVGKFGQRALAQVLGREVWPQGVHVAHLLIDADIREGEPQLLPQAEPADIASAVLFLHRQRRSAWTSELDLRPWNERFWEHC